MRLRGGAQIQALIPTLIVVSLLTLGGCGSEPGNPQEPTLGDGSSVVKAAMQDLAEREDVDVSTIEFVSREAVTWSDGSLGCAKPGVMYTQALVEGQRVVLRMDGVDYEYHSAGKEAGALCKKPTQ